ncbi:MAG: HAMP domain-containing sensor histidine kinase [Candidatus Paceibacterota bacterium]
METSIQTFMELCQWDTARFLIFSNNVFGALIYYSHFVAIILSLIVGFFVFFRDKKSLINRILFFIMISFSLWVFFDLILWANEKNYLIMFFWSMMIIVEPLIYALCVYFIDVFINKKDISFRKKLGIFSLLLPIIILLPTTLTLVGFDLTNCYREPIEGFMATYYVYIIEIIYALWILVFAIRKYKQSILDKKKQIVFITLGVVLFLLSFVSGNIIGSFTENWTIAQIGLFSMPIFVGFLAYAVVKFKSFNIKLMGTQVLVFALGFLVLAILFIRNIENVRIVVSFTLLFVIVLGYALIKSVKKEVKQREKLEELSTQLEKSKMRLEETNLSLEVANEKLKGLDKLKTEFVSLASHQLRSPLTAIKGYISMILDGDYGEINPKAKEKMELVAESSNSLTLVVDDLLNVAKIEQGGMKYEMAKFDFGELVLNTAKELSITAEKKGLKLICSVPLDQKYFVNGDKDKLRQVLVNLIDNSIKYTKEGQIEVNIHLEKGKIILSVKDTGVGISPGAIGTLFEKFSRGDGGKLNTGGSGLGLYLVKEIAKAHNGRAWAESEGVGKGSTFSVELDEAN